MAPIPDSPETETHTALPASADVVVIGGGIIGVCTALELAERKLKVVLCEKGRIAGEQSSRNWGWCRQMGRDSREMALIVDSLRLWRTMNQRIGAETGFRTCGIVYLEDNEAALSKREAWAEKNARPFQIDSRIVRGEELDQLVPGGGKQWAGALYTASDGRAEPQQAVPAMATAARARGAKIFTQCAVRGIETGAGRVAGVVTEHGAIRCGTVVVAGGAWSRRFLGNLGLRLPQLITLSSVQRTAPLDIPHQVSFAGDTFAARKRLDGGYTIAHPGLTIADVVPASFKELFKFLPALRAEWPSLKLRVGKKFIDEARLASRWRLDEISPFEQVRILDPAPLHWVLDQTSAALKAHYPAFAPMTIAERWAGTIDVTPDAVPVISAVDSLPGLHLATGFSGHGFGIGPGAGKLMADIVTASAPVMDPAPFRYSRFIDGSRLRPETDV